MYTNIQQDQKAKLYYHMSMLFAYMAGGERVGVRGLKRFCQRGSEYFLLPSCVCVGGGVRYERTASGVCGNGSVPLSHSGTSLREWEYTRGQVQYLSFHEKRTPSY